MPNVTSGHSTGDTKVNNHPSDTTPPTATYKDQTGAKTATKFAAKGDPQHPKMDGTPRSGSDPPPGTENMGNAPQTGATVRPGSYPVEGYPGS